MDTLPEVFPSEYTCMGIHFQAEILFSALAAWIEYVEDLANCISGQMLMKFNREFSAPVRCYLPEEAVKLTPRTVPAVHFTIPLINWKFIPWLSQALCFSSLSP
jgi:hypothetical protein